MKVGNNAVTSVLSLENDGGRVLRVKLVSIFDRNLMKKGNHAVVMVTYKWLDLLKEDATREEQEKFFKQFPEFNVDS
jgi:cytolysin (calcineurin-like family phosphatase)